MGPGSDIPVNLVDNLLALLTREQQTAFLRTEGLLNADGLERLLDVADGLLNDNPGKALRLAELCAALAELCAALAAVPRANYIRGQAHFINGEFDVTLGMIEAAYREYAALGMNLDALRTNVGKMAALIELGRYGEALDAGQAVLDALNGKGDLDVTPTQQESDVLAALVQQNRGGCLEYMGRYDEALNAYASAEQRYRALDMKKRVGEVLDNRGVILSAVGRGSEALAVHEAAAAIFEAAGLTLSQAMALGNIGETHLRLANYMDALDAFEQARNLLGCLDAAPVDESLLLRDTADAYLSLNLHAEALAAYREADGLLRDAGMVHDRARTLWGMGSAMIARSGLEEAEEALAEAARLFAEADNAPMLSGVMLEQASLAAARGDRTTALATARRALDLVSEESWPVQQVYARLRLADLLLPDTDKSEPHLLAAQRLADHLALPQLRYRLHERLGHVRRLQGRDEEARVLLEAAVERIERLRGAVAQDAMRTSFLRDKTAAYEDLLLVHLARDGEENVRRAFAVAERAKSRALVDLLTGITEKEALRSADSEIESRIRSLQADLNAIYGELLGGSDDGRPVHLPSLHARAVELEEEISRLRLQRTAVDAPPKPFAAPMPLDAVQELLPSDVALLAYHVVGDEVMAFLHVGDRVRVARRLSTVATVQRLSQRLTAQWGRFRLGREFAERNMALMERSARQVLSALYDELMAPLETFLEKASDLASGEAGKVPKLAVVPHGLLHRVPFHALFDGERYLLERFEISYAPSATVFALCQAQVPHDPNKALVFGVEDPSIPAATLEAHAVAERLPEAELRVGDKATVAALQSASPGCNLLHLACHGLFRSDNPMFSALKLHDGWLIATDAMQLALTGALVTLSACESGRSEVIGGDEVIGLTRAFLGAGAATLVVSLWLAQDETTADLMGRWYERLQIGEERTAALRAAQLEVRERYPHPYYWAPFVLIGKR